MRRKYNAKFNEFCPQASGGAQRFRPVILSPGECTVARIRLAECTKFLLKSMNVSELIPLNQLCAFRFIGHY